MSQTSAFKLEEIIIARKFTHTEAIVKAVIECNMKTLIKYIIKKYKATKQTAKQHAQ